MTDEVSAQAADASGTATAENGAAAAAQPTTETSGASTSALAAGSEMAAAAPQDFIPEKYRVNKEDGSLDIEASARKVTEAHSALEKRLGGDGAPPKTAEEYTATVPDTLKDKVDLSNDELYKSLRNDLHAAGLTQKQFDAVMDKYWSIAPALVGAGQQLDASGAEKVLRETWKDSATYSANIKLAASGATKMAELGGMSFDDLEASGLANNPAFIKIAAALAPEFGEDKQTVGATGVLQSGDAVKTLMSSEAYQNPKHPEHDSTVKRVRAYFERQHGNTAVV